MAQSPKSDDVTMAFRYPEQYTTEPGQIEGVRQAALARAARPFEVIEQALTPGPFVLGAEYSACDAYLFMLAWWAERYPQPPARLPRLRGCLTAVAARPATERACRAEGITVTFRS